MSSVRSNIFTYWLLALALVYKIGVAGNIDSRTESEWAEVRAQVEDIVLLEDIPTWREYFRLQLRKTAEPRAGAKSYRDGR